MSCGLVISAMKLPLEFEMLQVLGVITLVIYLS
jgi:hypothetical protein